MPSRRALFLVLLLVVVVACSEETGESTPMESSPVTVTPTTVLPTTTEASTATTTTPDAPSGIEGLDFEYLDPASFATIELVDAGAEPLEVRSWAPPVGTVVAMTTTLGSESTQTAGGAEPTNTDFTATIDSTIEIVALTDEGFVSRTVFDSTEVSASDPLSQSALEAAYGALIGVEVYQLTRPDGAIIAQAGVEALGQGDALGNGLGGIAVPLPTEAIGIGAVWTAEQVIGVEGIQLVQTVTTRIIDIQGDVLTIEIEAMSAFDPDSDVAALGPIELQGTSTGTAVWGLSIGMPISAVSESIQDVNSTDPAAPFSVRTITTIEITAELLD